MGGIYRRKNIIDNIHTYENRTSNLETETKVPLVSTSLTQELTYQFQSTNYGGAKDGGDCKICPTGSGTAIDEETNAAVAAYATFDDVGGNAAASASVFDSSLTKVPILDGESRVGYYHGKAKYIQWDPLHPTPTGNTKSFVASNSVQLNVPGALADDQKSFVYYDTHANFNISVSISVSLWFYPTDLSQVGSETFRFLLYRYIDASNYFMILLKPADDKIYVFTNEAGATTKLVSAAAVNANQWNNIIFTYNPSANALVIYLNGSSSSSVPADSPPSLYTANSNMYLGNIPGSYTRRFSGYMDNFVFWTGKILTAAEATSMWNDGTIV